MSTMSAARHWVIHQINMSHVQDIRDHGVALRDTGIVLVTSIARKGRMIYQFNNKNNKSNNNSSSDNTAVRADSDSNNMDGDSFWISWLIWGLRAVASIAVKLNLGKRFILWIHDRKHLRIAISTWERIHTRSFRRTGNWTRPCGRPVPVLLTTYFWRVCHPSLSPSIHGQSCRQAMVESRTFWTIGHCTWAAFRWAGSTRLWWGNWNGGMKWNISNGPSLWSDTAGVLYSESSIDIVRAVYSQ